MPRYEGDADEDDIAYVGDEDDARGPGCLAVMAVILGSIGVLSFIGITAWLFTIGAFFDPGVLPQPGVILFASVMFFIGVLAFIAGAFGLGFGLYSEYNLQLSNNPAQTKVLARSGSILGGITIVGFLAIVVILIVKANF